MARLTLKRGRTLGRARIPVYRPQVAAVLPPVEQVYVEGHGEGEESCGPGIG